MAWISSPISPIAMCFQAFPQNSRHLSTDWLIIRNYIFDGRGTAAHSACMDIAVANFNDLSGIADILPEPYTLDGMSFSPKLYAPISPSTRMTIRWVALRKK